MLVDTWKTCTLVPLNMCASMALVQLPHLKCVASTSPTSDEACTVQVIYQPISYRHTHETRRIVTKSWGFRAAALAVSSMRTMRHCLAHFGHTAQNKLSKSLYCVRTQNFLYEMGIECPVKCIQQTLYVRVSAQILSRSVRGEGLPVQQRREARGP